MSIRNRYDATTARRVRAPRPATPTAERAAEVVAPAPAAGKAVRRERERQVEPVPGEPGPGPRARPHTESRRQLALALRMQPKDPELVEIMKTIDEIRPHRRGECAGRYESCPWVSCRYHLYLEVSRNGSIKYNFPDLEPWELPFTCALDVADSGEELHMSKVGSLVNLTRERIRQCVDAALSKLSKHRHISGDELL